MDAFPNRFWTNPKNVAFSSIFCRHWPPSDRIYFLSKCVSSCGFPPCTKFRPASAYVYICLTRKIKNYDTKLIRNHRSKRLISVRQFSNEVSQTNFRSKKVFDAENFGIDQKITTEFKDGSDPCHFIFEFNVGKRRIRHKTSQKLIDKFLDRLKIDWRL